MLKQLCGWKQLVCKETALLFFFKGHALYDGGFFLKKDHDAAKVFYELSAKDGCPWGMVYHCVFCNGDEKLAWYAKALATNDDYACGWCYCFGYGVEKNKEKAWEYLLRAAQQGNPFAQTLIANQSLCKTDEANAIWLEKAATYGDASAQYLLAWKYGVEMSDEKAFFWYLQGARQKHSSCCLNVAQYYENGTGCEKNLPMSAVFFLKYGHTAWINRRISAKFDDPVIRLQELFVYGKGLKKDAKLRAEFGEENCQNAIRIYEESTAAARKAVLCFIWICKQTKYLNRDIQRMIGTMVLESRENPSVWNVCLETK